LCNKLVDRVETAFSRSSILYSDAVNKPSCYRAYAAMAHIFDGDVDTSRLPGIDGPVAAAR